MFQTPPFKWLVAVYQPTALTAVGYGYRARFLVGFAQMYKLRPEVFDTSAKFRPLNCARRWHIIQVGITLVPVQDALIVANMLSSYAREVLSE